MYKYFKGEKKNPFDKEHCYTAFTFWGYESKFENKFAQGNFAVEKWAVDINNKYQVEDWHRALVPPVKKEAVFKVWLYELLFIYLPKKWAGGANTNCFNELYCNPMICQQPTKKNNCSIYKYFKGEVENPFEGKNQNAKMFWFYEQIHSVRSGNDDYLIIEYIAYGLEAFENNDGTPLSLKALLFNRYMKWAYSVMDSIDDFKEFYKREYIGLS